MRLDEIRSLLDDEDRRSIAGSDQVLPFALNDEQIVKELALMLDDENPLVAMRALDLLEKVARVNPDLVQPHRRWVYEFESDLWEVQLQLARIYPLLKWTPEQEVQVISRLQSLVGHEQLFVKAWALDSLATFSVKHPELRPEVDRLVNEFLASPHGSLKARAREIAKRLG